MKRPFATLTMLVAGLLTVAIPSGALAELTFEQWATAEGHTPPGIGDWYCQAYSKGITSADGVSSYTNLQTLDLRYNQIPSLDPNQFQGLTNLQHLYLSNNQIPSLDPNQFQGLTNLKDLNLGGNQISSLDPNQFQGLTNLRLLSLDDNQISSLDPNQFQGLTNLKTLYLARNQISSLDPNQFQGLTNLQWLFLEGNQISSLPPNQFQGLTNLQHLHLHATQISSLDPNQFQGLTNLKELTLSDNQISSLPPNQFQGLTNLQMLYFGFNQISSLAPNQFQGLTNLQRLYLSHNQISSLDLTGFEATELTGFYINENPIDEVILSDATLSQATFDTLMTGGIAELAGIGSLDFSEADLREVDQFDEMFAMADLETMILTNALFSDAIVADGYAEVWDWISALELNQLDALTVDRQLYTNMQANLDTWDAGPNNVLTVVPEPSTLTLLAIGSLALLRWRKRAISR